MNFKGTVCDCTLFVCIDIVKKTSKGTAMGRKNTITMQHIRLLCKASKLNEKELYQKTKSTLSAYREICWTINSLAFDDIITIEFPSTYRTYLELVYWLKFVPKLIEDHPTKKAILSYYRYFFSEVVKNALIELNEYPTNGNLYKSIIEKCYLGKQKLTENEILNILPPMDRSTYYDKKKEAVLLFGVIVCGQLKALSQ